MAEVAPGREDHRHAGRVAGLDHLVVALRAAGLDDRPHARLDREPAARPANGKNASDAIAAPSSDSPAARALSIAIRTESTRLICPAPIPTVPSPRASTIAFERTCLQTRIAEQQLAPLLLARLALVTTCISSRCSQPGVAVLHEQPAADALQVVLGHRRCVRRSWFSSSRTFGFC